MGGSTRVVLRVICVTIVCLFIQTSNGAKILGVFPMPATSHYILGTKLLKELAARGHEVTMISCFSQKNKIKGYRDIVLDKIEDNLKSDINLFSMENMWTAQQVFITHMIGMAISNTTMNHPNVQELLNNKEEKFDLVITELFMNEMMIGLAYKYNCPYIIMSTMGANAWTNSLLGNPAPYAYVPDLFLKYSGDMNFWQRMYNTYFGLGLQIFRHWWFLPIQDEIMHIHFKDAPPLMEMMRHNLSLILLNSHSITTAPLPHVPAMIEIGGFHVEDPKPLPKELQEFMDNATDGVILFSMGSNLKSAQLPTEKRQVFLRTFGKLKQKVLWKWEEDVLPGQPKNVKLSKWLPQNDLMAHPNLRAFVTHGGLLSTTEAIHHAVPIVGIPIFGDQKMNMAQAVKKKYGLAVPYDELSEQTFTNALNAILNDPVYRQNVRKMSSAFRDQPVRPIDSAIFWTEHVLRHKGAQHFSCASQNLKWYQLYLVDVFAFSFILIILFLGSMIYLIRSCCQKKQINVKHKQEKKKKQ